MSELEQIKEATREMHAQVKEMRQVIKHAETVHATLQTAMAIAVEQMASGDFFAQFADRVEKETERRIVHAADEGATAGVTTFNKSLGKILKHAQKETDSIIMQLHEIRRHWQMLFDKEGSAVQNIVKIAREKGYGS